jgi:RNA polymerase sigma factor (sigma-70 family)
MPDQPTKSWGTHSVHELVAAAKTGDQDSWATLVRRYQPVVNRVTRRYRLGASDAADVSQEVWMRLATHLDAIREPEAITGWIATTSARCALEVVKERQRIVTLDPHDLASTHQRGTTSAERIDAETRSAEAGLLSAERVLAVRRGLACLSPARRTLLLLLVAEPRLSYKEIHERLGLPVGSIGPTRARCIDDLRQTPAIRALMATGDEHSAVKTSAA